MTPRWLDARDLAQWRTLRSEALREYPEAFLTTLSDFQTQSDTIVRSTLDQGKTLGIFDGTTLLAAAAFLPFSRPQTAHRAELAAFYVKQSLHGTQVADRLMTALISHANDNSVTQLELFVWDGNQRAIRFYQRHGFVETGRLPSAVMINNEARDDIFMVRQT